MWVTGPTGSGKSLLRAVLSSLGSGLVSTVQDVSKAGLAQPNTPNTALNQTHPCLLYTSPSPRDRQKSRMPSSA